LHFKPLIVVLVHFFFCPRACGIASLYQHKEKKETNQRKKEKLKRLTR